MCWYVLIHPWQLGLDLDLEVRRRVCWPSLRPGFWALQRCIFDAKWCRVRLDRLHQTLDLMNRQNGCLLKSWRILFWPTPGCEWKLLCICCAYLPDFPGKTRGLRGWKFGRGAGCRDFAKITASWGRALEKLLDVGGQGLKLQCAHAGGVGWKLGWLSHVAPVKSRSIE